MTGDTLRSVLRGQVDKKTAVMTDDAGQYRHLAEDFARHEAVNHGIGEYVRGVAHTNTAEGYFSILKRGIIGTYHHVSAQHLKRYLAEFDFRYNNRSSLGVRLLRVTDAMQQVIDALKLFLQSPRRRRCAARSAGRRGVAPR